MIRLAVTGSCSVSSAFTYGARPYNYGAHKVLNLKEGTVTATFKNVPAGKWTVGMHAFNRTSEDGKKVFSPWSNLKTATVK